MGNRKERLGALIESVTLVKLREWTTPHKKTKTNHATRNLLATSLSMHNILEKVALGTKK
jgi:hypothetical protein